MEYFINIMFESFYYLKSKDEGSYVMRPLIYDSKFKIDAETTQAQILFQFFMLKGPCSL